MNNANIDKMFYAGDLETKFSGTIIYSTVTTNYTIAVEKYNRGERLEDVSLFNAGKSYTADLEEMSVLIGASRIKRKVRAMTRGDEFGSGGYMLPEVIVIGHRPTPTPPPSFPPPPPSYPIPPNQGPAFPPYTPPPYMPPVPPPSSGSSHGGGSGGRQQYPIKKLISPAPEYDEMTKKVNEVLIAIYEKLKEKGIDLSKFSLKIATACGSTARKEKDGVIGICMKFVNGEYTLNDQISIIWHEIYHVNSDKDCSMNPQDLPSEMRYPSIPSDIENYIRNDLYDGKISNLEYQRTINVTKINAPEYYRNEIAAYQAEINNGINVSPAYSRERNFLLWRHQQSLKIAEQYYNK